jgi:hypothetical protein
VFLTESDWDQLSELQIRIPLNDECKHALLTCLLGSKAKQGAAALIPHIRANQSFFTELNAFVRQVNDDNLLIKYLRCLLNITIHTSDKTQLDKWLNGSNRIVQIPHLYEYYYVASVLEQFVDQLHPNFARKKTSDTIIDVATMNSASAKFFESPLSTHEKCELVLSHHQVKHHDFICEGGYKGRGTLCKDLQDGFAVTSLLVYEFTIPIRVKASQKNERERRIWVNVLDRDDIGTSHPICRSLVLLEPWDIETFGEEEKWSRGSTFTALAAMLQREKTRLVDTVLSENTLWEHAISANESSGFWVEDRTTMNWLLMNPLQTLQKMGAHLVSMTPRPVETLFRVRDRGAGQIFGYPVFIRSARDAKEARPTENVEFISKPGKMGGYSSDQYPPELQEKYKDQFLFFW